MKRNDLTRRDVIELLAAVPGAAWLGGCYAGDHDSALGSASRDTTTCNATTPDAEGPFYETGAPTRTRIAGTDEPGIPLHIQGRLLAADCQTGLGGYLLDVWQADAQGNYIVPGMYTDDQGRYRPAHIHFKVLTPDGQELLTTQMYFEGDPYLGAADYCTVEGTCNSSDPARYVHLDQASSGGRVGRFDIVANA
jgi:protocatechuate 3,4-dioxygenase beta subunit